MVFCDNKNLDEFVINQGRCGLDSGLSGGEGYYSEGINTFCNIINKDNLFVLR